MPRSEVARRRAGGIAALLVLVTACSSGSATTRPTPSPATLIPGVVTVNGLSHEHVTHPVTYPTHPPMGGPHWPPSAFGVYGWQACAVYTEPVVDEFAVHSLEHGAVWITYLPSLSSPGVAALDLLARIRPDKVLVSPYPGEKSPVTITAWGAQLTVDDPHDPRLVEFVRQYAGGAQGGEPRADCAHGPTVAEAMAAQARAAAARS